MDLDCMNKALLMKWLWNLENSEGMWQELLWRKYVQNSTLSRVQVKIKQLDVLARSDECKRYILQTM
jgi:hypothetical protein